VPSLAEANPKEPISVVISTLNRGDQIVPALKSILANDYPAFDIIVVDQNIDNTTAIAVAPLLAGNPIKYIRSSVRGLANGHNLAVSHTKNELIAFTDDDCVVPVNWLSSIYNAFQQDKKIGLVFGNVVAADYDKREGYTPDFVRDTALLMKSAYADLRHGMGIGACFAMRRSAWSKIGGFDTMLGPGSPLGSLEDRDIAIRVLLANHYVYQTPEVSVLHYGFRPNSKLRNQAFQDWFGFGSSYAKYLKCGHWKLSYYMLVQMWLGCAVMVALQVSFKTGRIKRATPVLVFWYGFMRGLFASVDRKTSRFTVEKKDLRETKRLVNNPGLAILSPGNSNPYKAL